MTVEQIQAGEILLVDKPLDWTSFQAVNKIKYKLKREFGLKKIKVGHAGTLDPKATGLLVVCTGKSTKKISEIQDAEKEYIAEIKIGVQTASYDSEMPELNFQNIEHITEDNVHEVLMSFVGEIEQKPPIFSALKVDGERAYNLARSGGQIEMKSRRTTIHYINNIDVNFPFITFTVGCSKGTYIRSLAHDIGEKLKVGAYLTQLRRTKIGELSVSEASSLFLTNEFNFQEY